MPQPDDDSFREYHTLDWQRLGESLLQNACHPACEKVTEITGEGAFAKNRDEWEETNGL
jgi:hypothetical protein